MASRSAGGTEFASTGIVAAAIGSESSKISA